MDNVTRSKIMLDTIAFAVKAHSSQMYGDKPYLYHLTEVAEIVQEHYPEQPLVFIYTVAAFLHDTLEDTDTTKEQLDEKFGAEVANIVWACTGVGSNRKERQACIKQRIAMVPEAAPVKAADRLANLEACIREKNALGKFGMYAKEHEDFKSYIKPLVNPFMWEQLDTAIQYGIEQGWANGGS